MTTRYFPDQDGDGAVSYNRDGRIARIQLDRPAKLNAFNARLLSGIDQALEHFDDDEDAWVCVLDGAGRAFSTGADVNERQAVPPDQQRRTGGPGFRGPRTIGFLRNTVNWKPVVAAAHGYAFGIGLNLLLEADLCVADETTVMEITEVRRGLWGHMHWLRMHARGFTAFADEVAITGRQFTGREAATAGMITRAVAAGTHLDSALELAESVARMPPLAVRDVIHARRFELERTETSYPVIRSAHPLHLTEDFQESVGAFVEGRPVGQFHAR